MKGTYEMKAKKITAIITLIACSAALFTGCGKQAENKTTEAVSDDNVTAAGELPIVKEKITLKLGVPGTSFVEDYKTNAYTKYLEEKTNINLEFYEFPSSGGGEKLNVMLASNTELPDIICGFHLPNSTFMQYADQEVFLDLTDYMDKYGYWINDMKEQSSVNNFEACLTAPNGKKYFVPNAIEQIGNWYGGKAFINKKWLDKLGLKMPETTDEFEKVMEAFVTQDPNGNGKNDEIGFTGSKNGWNEKPVNFLMNSFVYDDYQKGLVLDDNGKISLNYMSDEYKEGLDYIRRLAETKALDAQCYTQDNNTLRSLCASEDTIVGAFASGSPDSLFVDDMTKLQDYVALPPLKGPKGVGYALRTAPTMRTEGIITKYCKYPAAAYRLLDFMLSEEASIFARYGVEGKDWKRVDENTPCLFKDIGFTSMILPITAYSSVQNSNWHQYGSSFRSKDISNRMAWSGDELDGEYFKAKALTAYLDKGPKNVIAAATSSVNMLSLDVDDQTEFDGLATQIEEYVKESISLFVSGTYNLTSDWDKFKESLNNLDVNRYLELWQKGYDRFISQD